MSISRICAALSVVALFLAVESTRANAQPKNADPNLVYINFCVLNEKYDAGLTNHAGWYNKVTRDSLGLNGEKMDVHFPIRGYASTTTWFASNEVMNYGTGEYMKYGLPRAVRQIDLKRADRMGGVLAFVEKTNTAIPPSVLYLPVGRGCVFQPYQLSQPKDLHLSATSLVSNRKFSDAIKILERPSLRRYTPSRILLGKMHASGYGLKTDTVAAKRLFQEATDLGDPDGFVALALMAVDNNQDARALTLFTTASRKGSGLADLYLAEWQAGNGTYTEALRHLRLASTRFANDYEMRSKAETAIAHIWESPRNFARDLGGDASASRQRDERAAATGDAIAQYLMGRRYELGLTVQKDQTRAVQYYELSAKQGFTPGRDAYLRIRDSGW